MMSIFGLLDILIRGNSCYLASFWLIFFAHLRTQGEIEFMDHKSFNEVLLAKHTWRPMADD